MNNATKIAAGTTGVLLSLVLLPFQFLMFLLLWPFSGLSKLMGAIAWRGPGSWFAAAEVGFGWWGYWYLLHVIYRLAMRHYFDGREFGFGCVYMLIGFASGLFAMSRMTNSIARASFSPLREPEASAPIEGESPLNR